VHRTVETEYFVVATQTYSYSFHFSCAGPRHHSPMRFMTTRALLLLTISLRVVNAYADIGVHFFIRRRANALVRLRLYHNRRQPSRPAQHFMMLIILRTPYP
jgi:hypothetical protein